MNQCQITLIVNDRDYELWVAASDTLLDVLHDELGMADVRYGCGEGVCGTCTVLLDGWAQARPCTRCRSASCAAAPRSAASVRRAWC